MFRELEGMLGEVMDCKELLDPRANPKEEVADLPEILVKLISNKIYHWTISKAVKFAIIINSYLSIFYILVLHR